MKKYLIVLALAFVTAGAYSQIRGGQGFRNWHQDRFYTGGSFSLRFGSITVFDVSPMLGYDLTEWLSAGIGGTYLYYRQAPSLGMEFKTNIFGARLFSRAIIYKGVYLWMEYEMLNMEEKYFIAWTSEKRFWVDNIYVGGGYRSQLGERSYGFFHLLFNIAESQYSPYDVIVPRAGIEIRL
jgi:hypothetical protein